MSKSLGNFFTIKDMLRSYHPEVLRFFLVQSHYRSPVDYSDNTLREARLAMGRFYSCLKAIKDTLPVGVRDSEPEEIKSDRNNERMAEIAHYRDRFVEAMDDDFNTPKALGHMFDAVRIINGFLAEGNGTSGKHHYVLLQARSVLLEVGHVLGILYEDPDVFLNRDRGKEIFRLGLDEKDIEKLVAERWQARLSKDWKRADEIRQILSDKGVVLQDGPAGTTWRIL
jgi:cysteinyl-tRNA synthetase